MAPCKGPCQLLHLAVPPAARNDGWNPPFAPGQADPSRRAFRKTCFSKKRAHLSGNTPLVENPRTTHLGPFGEVIRATGPMAKLNSMRFQTATDDDETDLLYYGYRYYNPSTGRWPSRDPRADLTARPSLPLPSFAYSETDFVGDDDETDGNDDTMAIIKPAYRFVDNNPINSVNVLGGDIYLQRGNKSITLNRWLHLAFCVDTWGCTLNGWQKDGKACFSFAMTGLGETLPSNKWLGWTEFNAGGPFERADL